MSKDAAPTSRPSSRFHFIAGLCTGTVSAVLLQPADLLKTRIQQSHSTALLPTIRVILSGPHAIRTLWRGTLPSVIRTGGGSALYFSALNALRSSVAVIEAGQQCTREDVAGSHKPAASPLSSSLPQLSKKANLLTGACARAFAGFVLMPVTVLKVRYESSFYGSSAAYNSLFSAAGSIWKQNGPRGFFAGIGATAVRDAPYAGLYIVFYEDCKALLSRSFTATQDLSATSHSATLASRAAVPINFASGMLAAAAATVITNPFDAIKTRLQLMPDKYRNTAQAARLIIATEGWGSLMDGVGLRMGRKAMSSALAWTVYEELISMAQRGLGDGV